MGSTSWPSPRVRTCTICIPTEPGCARADASRPGLSECQRDRPVSRVLSRAEARGRSSIWSAGHPTAHAADPRARAARPVPGRWPRHALLLGLAPGRVCRVSLRRPKPPASSLWHWSSPRGGRGLPAALRCGARTFLTRSLARDRPAGSLARECYVTSVSGPGRRPRRAPAARAPFGRRRVTSPTAAHRAAAFDGPQPHSRDVSRPAASDPSRARHARRTAVSTPPRHRIGRR